MNEQQQIPRSITNDQIVSRKRYYRSNLNSYNIPLGFSVFGIIFEHAQSSC